MKNTAGFYLLTILFAASAGFAGGAVSDYFFDNVEVANTTESSSETAADVRRIVEESETTNVVDGAKPSVVSIVISKEVSTSGGGGQFGFGFSDPFFDQFFGAPQDVNEPETEEVEVGGGSGFVISEDGLIATNRHVVEDPDATYTVVFDDGTKHDAEIVDLDELNDFAILRIDAEGLMPLPLGDSDSLSEGQAVIAIGNTLGEYSNTVTKGVVSGLSRDLGGEYSGLVQTDAAINQGNSGGPLLNLSGEVVGINTAVDRGGEGIGFAIPVNEAKAAIDSVEEYGYIARPALGIRYVPLTPEIAEANDLLYDYGAYIRGSADEPGVLEGSAADEAGLSERDIILEVDGQKIDEEHSLPTLLREYSIGDEVTLLVAQNGKEKKVKVVLQELPQE